MKRLFMFISQHWDIQEHDLVNNHKQEYTILRPWQLHTLCIKTSLIAGSLTRQSQDTQVNFTVLYMYIFSPQNWSVVTVGDDF
jgi:chaperone required for assembly of F1-ATPase